VNSAPGLLFGSAAILVFAGFVIVAAPGMQVRDLEAPPGLEPYTEEQASGRALYVSLGCVYCHSQQPRDPGQAPDGQRGWGRPTTPADYVYDYPHVLGTMRTGPDLANIGVRQPSEAWHLIHLYQPRAVTPWSIMPAYPFLFREVEDPAPGEVTVAVPPPWKPSDGTVVATPEAIQLVRYLQALDRSYPIPALSSDVGAVDAR